MVPVRIKWEKNKDAFKDIELPIIDPHVLVDYLVTKVGVCIPQDVVNRFWHIARVLEKEEWAVRSPATNDHIPLALYGDSAKCYGGDKLVGIFISFPLWRAQTRNSRWCICQIEEKKLYGTETMDSIMSRLAFSLNQLFNAYDCEKGRELCGGLRFTVTEYRGDWLWHKMLWQFSSSWTSAKDTCYRCECRKTSPNAPEKLYYNTNANWPEKDLVEFICQQLGHRSRPCHLAKFFKLSFCSIKLF